MSFISLSLWTTRPAVSLKPFMAFWSTLFSTDTDWWNPLVSFLWPGALPWTSVRLPYASRSCSGPPRICVPYCYHNCLGLIPWSVPLQATSEPMTAWREWESASSPCALRICSPASAGQPNLSLEDFWVGSTFSPWFWAAFCWTSWSWTVASATEGSPLNDR